MDNPRSHPDRVQIERFVRGETSRSENRTVVRHLLRGCLECQEAAGITWYQTEPPQVRLTLPEQAISNRS